MLGNYDAAIVFARQTVSAETSASPVSREKFLAEIGDLQHTGLFGICVEFGECEASSFDWSASPKTASRNVTVVER